MRNVRKPNNSIPPTGPAMQECLKEVGIYAQKVIRHRDTGHYVADFYVPGMQTPIQPSENWASMIQQRLAGLTIIDTSDTVAGWRSDKPVIWASVTFTLDRPELPQPSQRPSGTQWLNG